ncbi:hypothetical protein THRCLA_09239 [Thraustotheca clavata]|uniref:BZIP domain-containing protein n=1 Tax=Thraustotheca clavata TaxID=74557 RepID=A0A1V9YYF1_9STRA|nr:hypothetical protein THRCLA_09239 [Thraustotheca clavata]
MALVVRQLKGEEENERRKEHQRLRNRLKQKRHRDRFVSERDQLLSRIEELHQLATALKQQQRKRAPLELLSWKTVANGLAQASVESKLTMELLREECEKTLQLGRDMESWVTTLSRCNNVPDNGQGWTEITLMADPSARKMGLDWFTRHLHANTARMIDTCAFPPSGNVCDFKLLNPGSDYMSIARRIQIVYDLPFKDTYKILHDRIWLKLRGDTYPWVSLFLDEELVKSIDDKMLYRRSPFDLEESNYYVCREFYSDKDDRAIFLVGNFTQDASQPLNHHWQPRMFWYVLEKVSEKCTRLRAIAHFGPRFENGRVLTWSECSNPLDVDLSYHFTREEIIARDLRWIKRSCTPFLQSDYKLLSLSSQPNDNDT